MFTIERVDEVALRTRHEPLVELLIDAVESGRAVGFVLPLLRDDAGRYGDGLRGSIADGSRLLWIARDTAGGIGTVQLELIMRRNGASRAEVQKPLVHSRARRTGVGRALAQGVDAHARALRRGSLSLDTEAGSATEHFCRSLDYVYIGGLAEYACRPHGEWRADAIYFKTLYPRRAT
jgi:acetyltransferase